MSSGKHQHIALLRKSKFKMFATFLFVLYTEIIREKPTVTFKKWNEKLEISSLANIKQLLPLNQTGSCCRSAYTSWKGCSSPNSFKCFFCFLDKVVRNCLFCFLLPMLTLWCRNTCEVCFFLLLLCASSGRFLPSTGAEWNYRLGTLWSVYFIWPRICPIPALGSTLGNALANELHEKNGEELN